MGSIHFLVDLGNVMNLKELRIECIRHAVEHPTHGVNCWCMDELIRTVRVTTRVGIVIGMDAVAIQNNAQERVDYVLSMAGRNQ